ncbi:MAG: hypothetical protein FWD68_19510, partial [Alphaproteobacteria bacterium]|nr:hypothetical protein [Alphaproteobacteria bacterium]
MRKLREDQMNLNLFGISYGTDKISQEFVQMSTMLDACGTELIDLVAADLGMNENEKTGRQGMSAESAMRCAILKQYHQASYDNLIHLLITHSCTILFA